MRTPRKACLSCTIYNIRDEEGINEINPVPSMTLLIEDKCVAQAEVSIMRAFNGKQIKPVGRTGRSSAETRVLQLVRRLWANDGVVQVLLRHKLFQGSELEIEHWTELEG